MQIKAKPILKNKFWIIESGGERIGTLSKQEDKRYMYSCATGTEYFTDTKSFNSFIGGVSWDKATQINYIKKYMGFQLLLHLTMSCIMYKRNCLYLQKVKNQKVYIVQDITL